MPASLGNTRDRRAIVVGAAILVPSLLFVYGVQPYRRTLAATRDETIRQHTLLAHDRALVAQMPAIPAATATASQQLDREAGRLFNADDDLSATGDLNEYIAAAAKVAGVQLQHAETRPTLPFTPGVHALQVEVHAEGDLDGILHFVHRLEAGDKRIRIDPLTIERAQGEGDPAKPDTIEVLSLSATVYGYRLTRNLAPPGGSGTGVDGASSPFARALYDLPSVEAVVDHDPFAPTRSRAPISYQVAMAGGPDKSKSAPSKEPPCTLVGTVIPKNGRGLAMCQTGDAMPHIVRVGGTIAGYTLNAVSRGRAVFAAPDGKQIELRTLHPGT